MDDGGIVKHQVMEAVEEQYHELLGIAIQGFIEDTGREPTIEDMENALHCPLPHLGEDAMTIKDWWYVSELLHCIELFRSVRGSDISIFEPILGEVFKNIFAITLKDPSDELVESLMSFGLEDKSDSDDDDPLSTSVSSHHDYALEEKSDEVENTNNIEDFSFAKVSISQEASQRASDMMWKRVGERLQHNLLQLGARIETVPENVSKVFPPLIEYLTDLFNKQEIVPVHTFIRVLASNAGINHQSMPNEVYTLKVWLREEYGETVDLKLFCCNLCANYDMWSKIHRASTLGSGADYGTEGEIDIRKDTSSEWGGSKVPLPAGWQEAVDSNSGSIYYYNETTEESSWTRPGEDGHLDDDAESGMWRKIGSLVANAMVKTGQMDVLPDVFILELFPSNQTGRDEFLTALDSIDVNPQNLGEYFDMLLLLTGFSDPESSNLVDISVFVELILQNFDFSSVQSYHMNKNAEELEDPNNFNFDLHVSHEEREAVVNAVKQRMWMRCRQAVKRAMQGIKDDQLDSNTLEDYVCQLFDKQQVVSLANFIQTVGKMGISDKSIGADMRLLIEVMHPKMNGYVDITHFIKGIKPSVNLDNLQFIESPSTSAHVGIQDKLESKDKMLENKNVVGYGEKPSSAQGDVKDDESSSSMTSHSNTPRLPTLTHTESRMFRRIGAQFICAMQPKPGERYHNGLEDFLSDDVFSKVKTLSLDQFLTTIQKFGVTPEYLDSDWDVLTKFATSLSSDTSVDVGQFLKVFMSNFDSQRGIRRYEESLKLMTDRFSVCLVSHVSSVKDMDFASPTEQMAEVSRVLRSPLFDEEIIGSVGKVRTDDFLKSMKKLGIDSDTMGYCMDTLLALVDPYQTGEMDVDRFVDHIVSNFDSMAWFTEWTSEVPGINSAIRTTAANSIGITKNMSRLKRMRTSSFRFLSEEGEEHSLPKEPETKDLDVEARALLAQRVSGCLVKSLISRKNTTSDLSNTNTEENLSQEEILPFVWKAFTEFDMDHTGLIDLEEFISVMSSLGINEETVGASMKTLISLVDKDGDGLIDYDEFMEFVVTYFDRSAWLLYDKKSGYTLGNDMLSKRELVQHISMLVAQRIDPATINEDDKKVSPAVLTQHLARLFSSIDVDNSGSLSAEEFWDTLQKLDQEKTHLDPSVMNLIDADGNGSIDYQEFISFMTEYFDNSVLNIYKSVKSVNITPKIEELASLPEYAVNSPELDFLPGDDGFTKSGLMKSLSEFQNKELEELIELEKQLGVFRNDPVAKKKAATRLQAQVRRRQARKKVDKLVIENKSSSAAVKIQARARGFNARRHRKRMIENNKVAATKLQAGFRGFKARHELKMKKRQSNLAATKLQAGFRGHKARRQYRSKKIESDTAAIKLQAGFRGHVARRRCNKEKIKHEVAATKLQAGFRGHKTRQEIASQKEQNNLAATKLQAGFRGHRTRKMVRRESLERSNDCPHTVTILSPSTVLSPESQENQNVETVSDKSSPGGKNRNTSDTTLPVPKRAYAKNSTKKKKRKRRKKIKTKKTKKNIYQRSRNKPAENDSHFDGPSSIFSFSSPKSPTSTQLNRSSPQSLHMSLANGHSLHDMSTLSSPIKSTIRMTSSQNVSSFDWGSLRILKLDTSEDGHSLESLYRPLALPHLLPEAFDSLKKKIQLLWQQLSFPSAQRRPLLSRMKVMNKENYTLLVSHMMLLQSAHAQLVLIINKIRYEIGEDPVGVGTGAHTSPREKLRTKQPSRPAGSKPSFRIKSPRLTKMKVSKKRIGSGRGSQRNDQWAIELSLAISQFKAVTPWLQEFKYKGVTYA